MDSAEHNAEVNHYVLATKRTAKSVGVLMVLLLVLGVASAIAGGFLYGAIQISDFLVTAYAGAEAPELLKPLITATIVLASVFLAILWGAHFQEVKDEH